MVESIIQYCRFFNILLVSEAEFEPLLKSAKPRFKLSADLKLETFGTILTGTNQI